MLKNIFRKVKVIFPHFYATPRASKITFIFQIKNSCLPNYSKKYNNIH